MGVWENGGMLKQRRPWLQKDEENQSKKMQHTQWIDGKIKGNEIFYFEGKKWIFSRKEKYDYFLDKE